MKCVMKCKTQPVICFSFFFISFLSDLKNPLNHHHHHLRRIRRQFFKLISIS